MLNNWLKGSYSKFADAVRLDRTPHSIIISGPSKLGSGALALHMARLFLCADRHDGQVCGKCKSCQYFKTVLDAQSVLSDDENGFDSHPDVIALTSSKSGSEDKDESYTHSFSEFLQNSENGVSDTSSVKVDAVRDVCEWLSEGSVFGHGKVALISNAHTMMSAASNALLKTFEEPPADSLIILLCDTLENLPATVLSRAYKIQIPMVSFDECLQYLKDKLPAEIDFDRASAALALTHNSPIGALNCYNGTLCDSALETVSAINTYISKSKLYEQSLNQSVFNLPTDIALFRENAVNTLLGLSDEDRYTVLSEFIRELLKYKAGILPEKLPLLNKRNLKILCTIPAVVLFEVYEKLSCLKQDVSRIPNRAPAAVLRNLIDSLRN